MNEKKPLRAITGYDMRRAGWYASDGEWFCVVCGMHNDPDHSRIPKGAPVYHAGLAGLMYCLKHAPGDAVYAPAHTEGS